MGRGKWDRFVLGPIHAIEAYLDSTRRKRSRRGRPLILGYGRDAFVCYEGGRRVVIQAEMMTWGRAIYPGHMTWDGVQPLTDADRDRVIGALCADLDRRRIPYRIEQ